MSVLTASSAPSPNPVATPRAARVRILADDLTGACDSAVAFLTSGHSVRVWLGPEASQEAPESVQAFNTASRALTDCDAADAVFRAATQLQLDPQTLFFKKVDSAGRGPIAAEVLAAHQALGTRAILFAPSFPAAGRTVRDGVLCVADACGTCCFPLATLFDDDVLTAHIPGQSHLSRALAAGATCLICDAETQSELEELARTDIPNLLYAGSAGLARALAKLTPASPAAPLSALPSISSALTICGTQHPVTLLQLEDLAAAVPAHPLLRLGHGHAHTSAILDHFHRLDPHALILTGGDTALVALTRLGAHSVLLRGELAAGIPWGVIQGGLADSRVVVTKSGGFGAPDALTSILKTLTASPSA